MLAPRNDKTAKRESEKRRFGIGNVEEIRRRKDGEEPDGSTRDER